NVVAHAHGARREDRDVGAAVLLQAELVLLDALADLVVGDFQRRLRRLLRGVLDIVDLVLAPAQQVLGFGRVMAVTIDDHDTHPNGGRAAHERRIAGLAGSYDPRLPIVNPLLSSLPGLTRQSMMRFHKWRRRM